MKPLWKVKGFFNRASWKVSERASRSLYLGSVFFLCFSVSVCLCVCVSVSACFVVCVVVVDVVVVVVEGGEEEGGGGGEGENNRTIWAKVSLNNAETEQPYQVKRMIGGIGTCCSQSILKLEKGKDPKVSLVNLLST